MNKRQFKKMIVQIRKESEINLLTLNDAVINEMEKMTQKIRNKNYPDKKTFYHDNPKYHIIEKQINSGIKKFKKKQKQTIDKFENLFYEKEKIEKVPSEETGTLINGPMIKEPRSINKQIEFLEKKYCEREAQNEDINNIRPSQLGKSIIRGTEENQKIEKILMLNSYDNVINPLKPIISTGYKIGESRSWHKYDNETSWQEIIALNERINEIESRLLRSVLSFEIFLKTTLTETIKEIIKNLDNGQKSFNVFLDELEISAPKGKKSSEKLKEELKEEFAKNEQNMKKESGYERSWKDVWWYHIKSLSLGKFNTLLTATYKRKTLYEYNMARLRPELNKISNGLITYWLSYEKKEMLPRKVGIKKLLDNFRILRNSLCHNTPLLIFLDRPLKGKEFLEKELKDAEEGKKEEIKRDITKKSLQHRDRKSIINAMIRYNNAVFTEQKIELSSNGIILNYEVYRNTKLYKETKNKYENIEDMV